MIQKEITYSMNLAIELLLCAMIIAACGIVGFLGRQAYYIKEQTDEKIENAEAFADLYYFNNKYVTSDDIRSLIYTHGRDLYYYFVFSDKFITTEVELSKRRELDGISRYATAAQTAEQIRQYWSEEHIKEITSKGNSNRFKSELLRETYSNKIIGVRFYNVS